MRTNYIQFQAMRENTSKNVNFKLYKWLRHQWTSIASRLVMMRSISIPNSKYLCIVISLWPALSFHPCAYSPWCSKPSGLAESFMHHMVGNNTGGLHLSKLNPILYWECKGSESVVCAQAMCMQSSLTGVQTPKNENPVLSPKVWGGWCCRNCLYKSISKECPY